MKQTWRNCGHGKGNFMLARSLRKSFIFIHIYNNENDKSESASHSL